MICIDSEHYKEKRCTRESLISDVIGEGNVIDSFFVNRGHKDGPEIHSITDTGIILIHNQKSGKMVTKLIARPGRQYHVDFDAEKKCARVDKSFCRKS